MCTCSGISPSPGPHIFCGSARNAPVSRGAAWNRLGTARKAARPPSRPSPRRREARGEDAVLRTSSVRILSERDREAGCAVLDTDPVGNVFVASRLMSTGIGTRFHGAELWGHVEQGRLTALCYSGA